MRSLCCLLSEPRDPGAPVARRWDPAARADQVLNWGEFRRQVAGLCDRMVGQPDGPWVLLTEDAYAFAVGLLALWHSGRHAISPPNRQLGALRVLILLGTRPELYGSHVDSLRGNLFPGL